MTTTANNTAQGEYRIRIVHDIDSRSPFEEDEGIYPTMYEAGRGAFNDFSKGEIDEYLKYYLSENQIIYHQKKILALIDDDYLTENVKDAEDADDKTNLIQDALSDFISENIENKVSFCETFNILHYSGTSRGYSQGDAADVLIVPTPKHAELCGYNLEKVTKDQLHATFELFGYWAWGDVFGFIIEQKKDFTKTYANGDETEDEEWDEVDSCWGFFGDDPEKSGMLDYINYEDYGWSKEQAITMIEEAEIEYRD